MSLGIYPKYISDKETILTLDQDGYSFTGDDLVVLDEHEEPLLKCRGEAFTLGAVKLVSSLNGRELFRIGHQVFSLGYIFEAEKANGESLFTLTEEFAAFDRVFKAKFIDCSTRNKTHLKVVRGRWWRGITIHNTAGEEVARATRAWFTCLRLCSDKPSYEIKVAPGIDQALVVAICICVREAERSWDHLIFGPSGYQSIADSDDRHAHHSGYTGGHQHHHDHQHGAHGDHGGPGHHVEQHHPPTSTITVDHHDHDHSSWFDHHD